MAKILELMQLSPTMEKGTFVKWIKKPGEAVSTDTIIAEIETDKAVMEMMAFDEGILLATLAQEGDQLPVGAPIAIIGNIGEDISDLLNDAKSKLNLIKSGSVKPSQKQEEKQDEKKEVKAVAEDILPVYTDENKITFEEEKPEKKEIYFEEIPVKKSMSENLEVSVSGIQKEIIDHPSLNGVISIPPHITLSKSSYRNRYPATPLAKKLAQNYGIDLSIIQPADGNRIRSEDVENFIKNRSAGIVIKTRPDKLLSVSGIRGIIAERLLSSKRNIPHYYLTLEFDADPVNDLREKMNKELDELKENIKLSLNDFIIRACAKSLLKHPVVNSSWKGDHIVQYGRIDIGIAVALEAGLITPYIRNVDQLEFLEMVRKIRELVKRARERKLKPDEYTNGTFTVSNLGMYGIKEFSAVINEPESAIMAVGTLMEKPVVKNNQIQIGKTVTVTLSCDHRVIDGAEGASFLQTFKKYIENPHLMFM